MVLILTADIGGTNARFACFKDEKELWREQVKTHSISDISSFLTTLFEKHKTNCSVGILGVAGEVKNESCRLTHSNLLIDKTELLSKTCFEEVTILNDLEATSYSIPFSKERISNGNILVIGIGTGFGACFLKKENENYLVVPQELEQRTLDHKSHKQHKFFTYLHNQNLPLEIGSALPGIGFEHIHNFLTGEKLDFDLLKDQKETLQLYFEFFIQVLDKLTLEFNISTIYLTGGVVHKQFASFEEYLSKFTKCELIILSKNITLESLAKKYTKYKEIRKVISLES